VTSGKIDWLTTRNYHSEVRRITTTHEIDTYRERERTIRISWIIGLTSIIPDILAVMQSASVTMLTDTLRTGCDTAAIFLSWLVVRRVSHAGNKDYNYGYGKLENLASLAVAAALFISFLIVVVISVRHFSHPARIGEVSIGVAVAGISAIWNGWFWLKNRQLARREHSPIMESQWRIFRAKMIINVYVVLTMSLSYYFRTNAHPEHHWSSYIDPAASFLLAAFLLFSVFRMVSVSVYDLLDHSLEESMQVLIRRGLAEFRNHYVALHGIRSRRSGRHIYIEVFLEFDALRRMTEVMTCIQRIRSTLESEIAHSQILIIPVTGPVASMEDSKAVPDEADTVLAT